MMNPVDEVSIELSNPDGNIILEEGKSSKLKEDRGHRSTSSGAAKRPKLEEVVINAYQIHHQPKIFIPKWEIIFTVASAFAVFVDPLFCYIAVFTNDSTCYGVDETLMWTYFALRSAGDIFYATDIFAFIRRSRGKGQKFRLLRILLRICAAFPIPQAILVIAIFNLYDSKLFYLIPIQYTLRACTLYRWLDHHANIETAVKRLLKAALDFLPFILAAHIFGALWYALAMERMCVCRREKGQICTIPVLSANTTSLPFDFGIYLYALQSNMTSSRNLPLKMSQCIWWGLRNLSSFGSNLQTSFFKDEIIFSIVISISGLTLFLVYLNSRVQGSKKVSHHFKMLKLRQNKIETIYPDIIEQMRNMWCLGLVSLKKVPFLESTDEKGLKVICENLKPVTYGEDVYIIREGEPLLKMFFITRGTALTYTTTKGGTNVCKCLEKSDFYGEELLNWAFKCCSFSELPISTTTLRSLTKVEVFSIRANHLKFIVAQFWWHFRRELPRSQMENFAASSLQAFWRRRCARLRAQLNPKATSKKERRRRAMLWDKLTLN